MPKLIKTRVRGGILTITDRELVHGEGLLGTQHVRRFPLDTLDGVELLPSPGGGAALGRTLLLRLRWRDGQTLDVDGVGPIAARRITTLLSAMHRPPPD